MRVQHSSAAADQLLCTACGLSFELEQDGARLHVSRWPDSLPFLQILVPDDWRTAAELRILVAQMTAGSGISPSTPLAVSSPPALPTTPAEAGTPAEIPGSAGLTILPPAAIPQSAPPALDAAAIGIRVKQLRALGNSPKEIRITLTQAEKDPERVQAVLEIITRMERQEQARQATKLLWSLGILGLVVIILAGAVYIYQTKIQNQNQPAGAGAAGPLSQGTQAPNLAVKLLKLSTPVVNYGAVPPGANGASVSACPHTAQQAANLFGGQLADWYYPPGSNGWVMVRTTASADIFVPNGMKAAYMQLSNRLQLIEVQGPATLGGVYYVAISCP